MKTIPCLSIQQPWSYLVTYGLKDIENRDWPTPFRGRILIHAGKRLDPGCFDGDELYSPALYQMGAGLNIRSLVPPRKQDYQTGGIVGIATIVDCVTRSSSPWFRGKYGFVLKDARPLPRIPQRGQLGIFQVSRDSLLSEVKKLDPSLQLDWQGVLR